MSSDEKPPVIFFEDEKPQSRFARKAKESPFLTAGLAGLATVLGVAAYKFKTKGNMSTSVFLMQTRVAAQGAVVACLTLGLAYTMFNQHILHKEVKALKGEKVE